MKIISAALAAALVGGLAFGGQAFASSFNQGNSLSIEQVGDRGGRHQWHGGSNPGWWRPPRPQAYYYRPPRQCYTQWIVQYGYFGAQWIPVQRCYRGW